QAMLYCILDIGLDKEGRYIDQIQIDRGVDLDPVSEPVIAAERLEIEVEPQPFDLFSQGYTDFLRGFQDRSNQPGEFREVFVCSGDIAIDDKVQNRVQRVEDEVGVHLSLQCTQLRFHDLPFQFSLAADVADMEEENRCDG